MKKFKEEKGITLVALIITIVVLLILAAVAIGTVQDSKIIPRSQNAAESFNQAKDNEIAYLTGYEETINKYVPKENSDIEYYTGRGEIEIVYALVKEKEIYKLKAYTGEIGKELFYEGEYIVYLKEVDVDDITVGSGENAVSIRKRIYRSN